jgi:hypothetical protein
MDVTGHTSAKVIAQQKKDNASNFLEGMQPMTSWVQSPIISSRSLKLAPVLSQQVFFVPSWLFCQNMATILPNHKNFHKHILKPSFV